MSDKFKTVKKVLIACLIGVILASTILFQGKSHKTLSSRRFYTFMGPIGALADSISQRVANIASVPFGSIGIWGWGVSWLRRNFTLAG